MSLLVKVSKPAFRVDALLGAVSIPSFVLQVVSVDQRGEAVVGEVCAVSYQYARG